MDYSSYDISQYARGIDSYVETTDAAFSSATAAGVGAAFGAFLGIYIIFALVISVLQIIAIWKIFSKSGESGWKSLIPIYNVIILFKVSGLSPWLILAYLAAIIPVIGWIVPIVITILQANGLSKSFGKSTGFTIGLILLPSIFYLILGLSSSTYIGTTKKENPIEVEQNEN